MFIQSTSSGKKFLLYVMNATDGIHRIRVASTEQYRCNNTDGVSTRRWRELQSGLFYGKVDISVDQTLTGKKRTWSSLQFEIGNSCLSNAWAAGCTRYIDVSRGALINEIVYGNGIVVKNNASIHNRSQQLDDIKPNSHGHCSSGKRALDISTNGRWWFVKKEVS